MTSLVFGVLAITALVIITMALSATKTGAGLVQGFLAVAILGVLLRNTSGVQSAIHTLQEMAISTTGKQTSSGGN